MIMAKIEIKFIDYENNESHIKVNALDYLDIKGIIVIDGICEGNNFTIFLDKSTAIRFAKTLRTEINKIQ